MNSRRAIRVAMLCAPAALLWASAIHAQEKPATRDERALLKLESDWIAAEDRRDAAALSAILDDRFIATFGSSKPMGKAAFILGETKQPPDTTVRQEISDRKIIVAGGTAVVVESDTLRRVKDGQPTLVWRFTVTYIKRGGRWLALAEQGGPARP